MYEITNEEEMILVSGGVLTAGAIIGIAIGSVACALGASCCCCYCTSSCAMAATNTLKALRRRNVHNARNAAVNNGNNAGNDHQIVDLEEIQIDGGGN